MTDYCIRATAANGHIRAFAASSRILADKARAIHNTTPVATAALGRTITAAAIMGLMSGNDEDLVTISIKGGGPLGGILATSDGLGRVRGYVHNPAADMPPKPNGKLDVGGAVGAGHLTIIKDLGLKEPYVGKCELISGEIAEDIAAYFFHSEQVPSVLSLGVLVDTDYSVAAAGGVLLQLLPRTHGRAGVADQPGHDEGIIDRLEAIMADFPPITKLLSCGKTPEDVLDMLLSGFGYEITEKQPIAWHCPCGKERVTSAIVSIGKAELAQIIEEEGKAEVSCHFCNKEYHFDKAELTTLLAAAE